MGGKRAESGGPGEGARGGGPPPGSTRGQDPERASEPFSSAGADALVERVLSALPPDAAGWDRARDRGGKRRFLLGIAGPPASGKSTLAAALRETMNRRCRSGGEREEVAAVAALDGFHYDDRVLHARGHRPRKGAPFTFDAEGYAALLDRLAAPPAGGAIAIPVFDRDLELSRAGAALVEPHHRVVITEGNYLLLDDARWRGVRRRLDFTVFLDVPAETLRRRLTARWLGHGYGPEEAREKTEANDLLNARLVLGTSCEPDLRLRVPAPARSTPSRPPVSP